MNWFHVISEMNLEITGCSWCFVDFTEFWLKNIFRVNFNAVWYFHSFLFNTIFYQLQHNKKNNFAPKCSKAIFHVQKRTRLEKPSEKWYLSVIFFHQKDSNMHEEHPWITTVQFILCLFSFSHSTYSDSNLYSPFFQKFILDQCWPNFGQNCTLGTGKNCSKV